MGVAGAGKSTLLAELGRRLGWRTLEGDALHGPASIAKMAAGVGLSDADRRPWLAAIASWIARTDAAGEPSIVACSALRRRYRDRLRAAGRDVRFVSLGVTREVLARRLAGRPDHFVPVSLLDSQLATLEPLAPDEPGIELDATLPPALLADIVVARLAPGEAAPDGGDDADRVDRAAGAGHRPGIESERRDPG
jgi:gluconokinase